MWRAHKGFAPQENHSNASNFFGLSPPNSQYQQPSDRSVGDWKLDLNNYPERRWVGPLKSLKTVEPRVFRILEITSERYATASTAVELFAGPHRPDHLFSKNVAVAKLAIDDGEASPVNTRPEAD